MRRLRFAPLLSALIPFARPVAAQVITERVVTGIVVDSVSGKPLKGVTLYFTSAREERKTGNEGRFRIEHVSLRDTVLVIRDIGYVPAYARIPASSSASIIDVGQVKLGPIATQLDRIAVETEEVRRFPQLEDFYRRKHEGIAGEFITREDIQRTGVRKTSQLLYRSAKVAMDCPHDAIRSGDENCRAGNRRGMIGGYRRLDGATSACEMDLFVDGRLSTLGVDEVPVDQIAAVEIYSGPATTPANFGQRACGVIAVWTTGSRGS